MDGYERVMAAVNHQRSDRVPLNFFGTSEVWTNLKKHLKLEDDEAVRRYIGSDMRYVQANYVGPSHFAGETGYATGGTDVWGIKWKPVSNDYSTYFEISDYPLKNVNTLKELENYPWPNPDWFDVSHIGEEIKRLNDKERYAIVFTIGHFFENVWYMCGMEKCFFDMAAQPEIPDFIMKKTTEFIKEIKMRAIEACDNQIDIIWSGSDVGVQDKMMFSPKMWRELVKPYHQELITPFKEMGLVTRYHTDGAVEPIIEDLIEMGLDILDPIQPNCPGMDAENLNTRFGGRLSFYGGLCTQQILPFGTPEDVEKDMIRLIETLGQQGGYIAAASNSIQPDVPIENVLTMFRTAREYTF